MIELIRYKNNPILSPNPQNGWEDEAVFNPGAILKDNQDYFLLNSHYNHQLRRKLLFIFYNTSSTCNRTY